MTYSQETWARVAKIYRRIFPRESLMFWLIQLLPSLISCVCQHPFASVASNISEWRTPAHCAIPSEFTKAINVKCNENKTWCLHQNDLLSDGSQTLTWPSRLWAGRGISVSAGGACCGRPFGEYITTDAAERRCLWSFISGPFQRQQLPGSLKARLNESLASGLAVRSQFSRVDFLDGSEKKIPTKVILDHGTEKRYHI